MEILLFVLSSLFKREKRKSRNYPSFGRKTKAISSHLLRKEDRYRTAEKRNRTLVNLIQKQGYEGREKGGGERSKRRSEVKTHSGFGRASGTRKLSDCGAGIKIVSCQRKKLDFPLRGRDRKEHDLSMENGILSNMQTLLALEGVRKNVCPPTFGVEFPSSSSSFFPVFRQDFIRIFLPGLQL